MGMVLAQPELPDRPYSVRVFTSKLYS